MIFRAIEKQEQEQTHEAQCGEVSHAIEILTGERPPSIGVELRLEDQSHWNGKKQLVGANAPEQDGEELQISEVHSRATSSTILRASSTR